jgi:hypothetical protein
LGNCVRCSLETGSHLLDSVIRSPKVAQTGLCPALLCYCLTHRGEPDAWQRVLQPARGGFWTGLRPLFRP